MDDEVVVQKRGRMQNHTETENEIKMIDKELALKLKELEQLMAGREGMTESAEALDQCIETHKRRSKGETEHTIPVGSVKERTHKV